MKNWLKLLSIVLAGIIGVFADVSAQESVINRSENSGYLPLLKEGKVWVWTGKNLLEEKEFPVYYTVTGTEDIEGRTYYRVEQSSEVSYLNGRTYLLSEDAGKVEIRFVSEDGSVEILPLFDFSMSVGQSSQVIEYNGRYVFEMNPANEWTVTAEDDINVSGISRRRMYLENEVYDTEKIKTVWVEGIGAPSFEGQLTWCLFDRPTNGIILGDFKECTEGGETIFSLEDFFIGTSVNCITDTGEDSDAVTYDMMGRQVVSAMPGGVYIRGGKKFIAR